MAYPVTYPPAHASTNTSTRAPAASKQVAKPAVELASRAPAERVEIIVVHDRQKRVAVIALKILACSAGVALVAGGGFVGVLIVVVKVTGNAGLAYLVLAVPTVTATSFGLCATVMTLHALFQARFPQQVAIPQPLTELEYLDMELKQIFKSCEMAVQFHRLEQGFCQLKSLQALIQPASQASVPLSTPMLVGCLPTLYKLLELPLHPEVQARYPQVYKECFALECHTLINWIESIKRPR